MAFFANMRFWQLKTRSSIVICFRSSLTIGLGICGVEIYDCQISNNLGGGNYDGMGIYSEYSGVVFFVHLCIIIKNFSLCVAIGR